jgi:hypothetical protein
LSAPECQSPGPLAPLRIRRKRQDIEREFVGADYRSGAFCSEPDYDDISAPTSRLLANRTS